MSSFAYIVAVGAAWSLGGWLQWRFMGQRQRRHMARLRSGHLRSQAQVQVMLNHCRRQITELHTALKSCRGRTASGRDPAVAQPPKGASSAQAVDLLVRCDDAKLDPYVAAVLQFAETQPMLTASTWSESLQNTPSQQSAPMSRAFADTLVTEPPPPPAVDVWAYERHLKERQLKEKRH